MTQAQFGRRTDRAADPPPSGEVRRVNRLFPQVVAYQCAATAFCVSLALIYLPHMPTGALRGLAIILVYLVAFAWFVSSSRNALIVDEKFKSAALANTGWVGPLIGFVFFWAVFALLAIIVFAEPYLEEAGGMAAMMFVMTWLTVTRRAQIVIQRAVQP